MKVGVALWMLVLCIVSVAAEAQDCTQVLRYAGIEKSEASSHYYYHQGSYYYSDSGESGFDLNVLDLATLGYSGSSASAIESVATTLDIEKRAMFYKGLSSQATDIYKACEQAQEQPGLRYYAEIHTVNPDTFTLYVHFAPPFVAAGAFDSVAKTLVSVKADLRNAECGGLHNGDAIQVGPNELKHYECKRLSYDSAVVKFTSVDWSVSPPGDVGVTIPVVDDRLRVTVRHEPYHVYASSVGNGYQLTDDANASIANGNGPRFRFVVSGPEGFRGTKMRFFVHHADKKRKDEALGRDMDFTDGQIPDHMEYSAGDELRIEVDAAVGEHSLKPFVATVYTVDSVYTPRNFKIVGATFTLQTVVGPKRTVKRLD